MPNVPNTQPAIMKPTEEHPAYTQITKVSLLTVQTDSGIHPPSIAVCGSHGELCVAFGLSTQGHDRDNNRMVTGLGESLVATAWAA